MGSETRGLKEAPLQGLEAARPLRSPPASRAGAGAGAHSAGRCVVPGHQCNYAPTESAVITVNGFSSNKCLLCSRCGKTEVSSLLRQRPGPEAPRGVGLPTCRLRSWPGRTADPLWGGGRDSQVNGGAQYPGAPAASAHPGDPRRLGPPLCHGVLRLRMAAGPVSTTQATLLASAPLCPPAAAVRGAYVWTGHLCMSRGWGFTQ